MKNKVKMFTAAIAVGMAAALSGCGGCLGCNGCSGCNDETVSNTLTRSNWFTGTSYNGIQPTFIEGNQHFSKEVISYDVTYDDTNSNNPFVALQYKDGLFTTEFYATKYDWKNSSIPEGYSEDKQEVVYIYKTQLTISVQYTLKKGDKAASEWFNDKVETVSIFRAAGKNLQPVYSKQKILSTSPATQQPLTLKDAYKTVDVEYENFYNFNCDKVYSYTTENGEKKGKEFTEINKRSNTLFDNSSLYTVIRSMKLSSGFSQNVSLFSAAAGGIDNYGLATTDSALTANERADYTQKLQAKGLYKTTAKEGEKDEGVGYVAVNVTYTGGNLQGTSQTVWYAAITNKDNNISRTTMLKLSVPLSFNLGTLNYSLKEISSTLWNG